MRRIYHSSVRWFMYALGLSGLMLASCESTPPNFDDMAELPARVRIATEMTVDGQSVGLNEPFTDVAGNRVRLVAFKFYLSDIKLQDDQGGSEDLTEIEMFDFKTYDPSITTPQWRSFENYNLDPGTFQELQFSLGVPEELNAKDPATFSNEHPLSVFSNMFWSWGSQYRFIILEAEVDTTGGENYDHDLIFHTGLDDLFRGELSYPINISLEASDSTELSIQIDWNQLFYEHEVIDLREENITHTTDTDDDFELARKLTDNFVKAISVKD